MTISSDGSTLAAGGTGNLITSAGTWTFGQVYQSPDYYIQLNGQTPSTAGAGVEMEVANHGNLYVDNSQGQWWEWNGSGWSSSGNPNSTTVIASNQSTMLNLPRPDSLRSVPADQTTLPSDLLWPVASSELAKQASDHTFTFNDVSDVKGANYLNGSGGVYMIADAARSFDSAAVSSLPGSMIPTDGTNMTFDLNKIVSHSPV